MKNDTVLSRNVLSDLTDEEWEDFVARLQANKAARSDEDEWVGIPTVDWDASTVIRAVRIIKSSAQRVSHTVTVLIGRVSLSR